MQDFYEDKEKFNSEDIPSQDVNNEGCLPDKKPHRWRGVTIKILGFIGILFLILTFFPIPFGSIRIVGSEQITEEDILVAGESSYPVNILQIDSDKVAMRLIQDLRISQAQVSYELPLTMKVVIEERVPVAVVMTQFGYAILDADGNVIQLLDGLTNSSTPIISGVRMGNVLLGDKIEHPAIIQGVTFLKNLTPTGKKLISEINVGSPEKLVAYTLEGVPLRLGNGEELEEKAKLAEDMLKDIKMKKMKVLYLDVNISAPFIGTDK